MRQVEKERKKEREREGKAGKKRKTERPVIADLCLRSKDTGQPSHE